MFNAQSKPREVVVDAGGPLCRVRDGVVADVPEDSVGRAAHANVALQPSAGPKPACNARGD
eukprot:7758363-Lingulodinium_polyedra.AAC.1